MWYGVFGEFFCLENFAWQAKAGFRYRGGRTTHLFPVLAGQWVRILGGEAGCSPAQGGMPLAPQAFFGNGFQPEPSDFAVLCPEVKL